MDFSRVKEIINSENTIEVLYNNQPIWINNLDPHDHTAQVTDADEKSMNVPVEDLVEGRVLE